jgi:hypothetical protein
MTYSVWCQGVLLGRTDLTLKSPMPNARVGYLDTTGEFDRLWPEIAPVVDESLAAAMAMGSVMADVPPAAEGVDRLEYGRQVYERIKDHPGTVRVRAASAALSALGLELRDDANNRVATNYVMVQEVKIPIDIPRETIAQHMEEARAAGYDVRFPSYIVSVEM